MPRALLKVIPWARHALANVTDNIVRTEPLTQVRGSGFFGKGDMQKEFEEASFQLKPGEISQVVQTASGLHLIERYVQKFLADRSSRADFAWLAGPLFNSSRERSHNIPACRFLR